MDANTRLYKFRLWCVVEAVFLEHWSAAEPDSCPHNAAHALDHAQTTVLDSIISGSIEAAIREEALFSDTGGNFMAQDYEITVPAGGDPAPLDLTWPFGVSLLVAYFWPDAASLGDEVEVQVAPDTVIGGLSAPAVAGATVFAVTSTVLDNMKRGYWATINGEVLGRCKAIDKAAATITVETALAADANAGALVRMTRKLSPSVLLRAGMDGRAMGDSKIGGSYLPAGKIVRVIYKNTSLTAKKFPFGLEYLY